MRLLAWGVTEADQERAIHRAGQSPSRNRWDFEIERASGTTCPLNLDDPKALASERGYHWAYIVLKADR